MVSGRLIQSMKLEIGTGGSLRRYARAGGAEVLVGEGFEVVVSAATIVVIPLGVRGVGNVLDGRISFHTVFLAKVLVYIGGAVNIDDDLRQK